jgi:type IV pilus assembly protein PilB
MARKIGEQLVSDGVVTPEMLERALERQKATGQKLGECLVRLGLDETPVLRLLAQELKTRFVSTVKLAQTQVDAGLLERVPVRLAEGFDFIPVRLDEAAQVLYVVMAEPQRHRAIEEIARTVGVAKVVPFIGVRRSIRAAIRKHYYSDANAFEHMSDDDTCPHCGAPCSPDDFQCARCELLLVRHPDDLPERDNVSLVRALISVPDPKPVQGVPASPHQAKTRVYRYALGAPIPTMIPSITTGLDLAMRPLNPFEAYILSFVDGRMTLKDISLITNLSQIELRAVFEFLSERGIIRVETVEEKKVEEKKVEARRPAAVPEARGAKSGPPVPDAPPTPMPKAAPREAPPPAASAPAASTVGPPGASGDSASDSILQRVVYLERNGKMEEAIELLEQGISQQRNPAPLYNRLGLILLNQQRDYARSAKLVQKAADLDPDNSIYMMNLYSVLSLRAEATNAGKKPKR